MISQGVDAIILNPTDREGLNAVIEAAIAQGIVVVAVDQAVTAEGAYVVTNDQVAYARIGAEWLFETLGGQGQVVEMRGIDGVPADTDRHAGFQEALAKYPDIVVSAETFTGWDPSTGAQQALDLITTTDIDGIWTSGIDYPVVEQFQTANVPFVPIVGADNNGFVQQLLELDHLLDFVLLYHLHLWMYLVVHFFHYKLAYLHGVKVNSIQTQVLCNSMVQQQS